jgi:type II secretory pathway pseudopilin PulG
LHSFGKRAHALRNRFVHESGFTVIELALVITLLGITSAMFSVVYGTTIKRSSDISKQSILQTEMRAALNGMVEDLRSSTTGDSVTHPIIAATNNSITFYSPDRLAPNKMRRVKYWLAGAEIKRQVTMSTNSAGPPWTGIATDTGPIRTVVSSIYAPEIPAQPDAPQSGWASGQIFKYCAENPIDLKPLEASEDPDPITWSCTSPGADLTNIKTIVIRAAFSATLTSTRYTYGAVSTLRWTKER